MKMASETRSERNGVPRRQITRRELIRGSAGAVGLLPALGGLATRQARARETVKPPNILFVMVDEMRWDVMGCAGHPVVQTPNLDRLAKDGVRFANTYTASPVCMPSRRSTFTSRYSHIHGVVQNGLPTSDGEVDLPWILKHYGYDTAISGKLHYLPLEFDYGFDKFWSYGNEGPGKLERYPQYLKRKHGSAGVHPFVPGSCPFPNDPLGNGVGKFPYPKEDFMSFWIADRAIDYLRSRKDSNKPWFLFTSFKIPHSPYRTPEPYYSMYSPDSFPVPPILDYARKMRADAFRKKLRFGVRHWIDNEEILRALTAQYYGHVTNVDDNLGRLFGELRKLGLEDNTIVVFASDHGNMLGEKGWFFKDLMYDGSARIPLIMKVPPNSPHAGGFRGGRVVNDVIGNVDIMPTLMELAGVPIPESGIQGHSFAGLAEERDHHWKNRCFSVLYNSMVRTPEFKLIRNTRAVGKGNTPRDTPPYELYDMRSDPREERNLAQDPKHKNTLRDLVEEEDQWFHTRPGPIRVPGMPTPDYAFLSPEERAKYSGK